jgi:hypothetical protein
LRAVEHKENEEEAVDDLTHSRGDVRGEADKTKQFRQEYHEGCADKRTTMVGKPADDDDRKNEYRLNEGKRRGIDKGDVRCKEGDTNRYECGAYRCPTLSTIQFVTAHTIRKARKHAMLGGAPGR